MDLSTDFGISAAVGTLGNLATSALNNHYQTKQWDREVSHEQSTYDRNRADYLADLENERKYNSPQQQINRLREAGLNPNLMNGGSISSGNSSGAVPMSSGNNIGMSPVTASDFTSGLVAASSAIANGREIAAKISGIMLDNQYKRIVNSYEEEARKLGNDKLAAEISATYQKISESVSNVTLNNSRVLLNGKQVELFDSQALKNLSDVERNEAEIALSNAKTVLTKLDACKAQVLLPYVGKRAAAELALTKARTATEKAAAYQHFAQADLAMILALKENNLIESGYVDALISEMKANASATEKNANTAEFDAITRRKSFVNDVVQQSINTGFDTTKKILHFIPGGKYIW